MNTIHWRLCASCGALLVFLAAPADLPAQNTRDADGRVIDAVREMAKSNPERLLEQVDSKHPDMRLLEALAIEKVTAATGVFQNVIASAADDEVRTAARLWLKVLCDEPVAEQYPKATPTETLRSFAGYLQAHTNGVDDAELEFWGYPGFFEDDWRRFRKQMQDEPAERLRLVQGIFSAVDGLRSGKTRVTMTAYKGREASLIMVGDEAVVSMIRDIFGRWKLSYGVPLGGAGRQNGK